MCTEKYVYPFTDFGFKLLFGSAENKEFLISFLNSLLDRDDEIIDITYRNTEMFGMSAADRKAVYDLYCVTSTGEHLIVEMQNAYQRYFLDRTVFYSSFPMQEAAKKGDWDYRLPSIYTVSFTNFVMPGTECDPDFKHVVKLADIATGRVFYDKLTYIYLEMPKFNKELGELESLSDHWLYVIKNLAKLDEKPRELRAKIFERFFKVAEIAGFSHEQRMAYEGSLKNMRDYANTISAAEEKGLKKGREEGMEEGMEMGRAEGMEKLKATARYLKSIGLATNDIIAATGLTESELCQL